MKEVEIIRLAAATAMFIGSLTSCTHSSQTGLGQKTNDQQSVKRTAPVKPTIEICEIHGQILKRGEVQVGGYIPLFSEGAPCLKDKKSKFPHSNLWTLEESISKPDYGWVDVFYCPKCREIEHECVKAWYIKRYKREIFKFTDKRHKHRSP